MRSRPTHGCSLIFQNGTVVPLLSVDPGVKISIRVIIVRKNGTSALREYLSRNSLSMGVSVCVCVRMDGCLDTILNVASKVEIRNTCGLGTLL